MPCSFCYYANMACKSFSVFYAIYHVAFLYRILDFTHNLKKSPETALSVPTTILLTLSDPVSMTAVISLSAVSAQKSRSDLTKSMRLPISFTAATRFLHTRSVQAKPLKWSPPHRKASGSAYARNPCLSCQTTLSVSGLPSICDCIRVPIF